MVEAGGAAGFILAGGASRRMGTDKALLKIGGVTLLERSAETMKAAVGNVTIIAPAGRYEDFGYPRMEDRWPGEGPLGGILTALLRGTADVNVIAAVDMPDLDPVVLGTVSRMALETGRSVVPTRPGSGWEPLCAAYQRSAAPALLRFFEQGGRRVKDAIALIAVEPYYVEMDVFASVNTPGQWEAVKR
jgi:molybdopterin-guanine dinucleotide biosynthesis protein A